MNSFEGYIQKIDKKRKQILKMLLKLPEAVFFLRINNIVKHFSNRKKISDSTLLKHLLVKQTILLYV